MSSSQNRKFIIAIVLVAIIAVGGTYAVMSSRMTGTTVTTSMPTSTATSVTSGGTLVVEELCCIDTLDPAATSAGQGGEAIEAIYQGLLLYAPNSSQIVPLLAESYNVSNDGLTYTFRLRQHITFTNGDPVNSYVFWYSIYRAALMAQEGSYLVTVAQNTTSVTADMLNQYTTATPPQSLIQIMQNPTNALVAPDPYTLIFHLSHPFAAFLAILTQPEHVAVDPVVVSAHGGVVKGQSNSWMSLNAVGNGPFMLQQYQPNSQLTLVRNPTYWGGVGDVEPAPRLDGVIIKYVPNGLTRVEDVQRGGAQMAYVDPSLVAQAVSAGGIYVPKHGPIPQLDIFELNVKKFPMNNTLIREAVVHAVNYTAILQEYYGFAVPFVGTVPHGVVGYASDLQQYSYNVTLAKQLLAQAGYPNGQGLPTITIIAMTDAPPAPDDAVIIQSNLADVGIHAKVEAMPYSQEESVYATSLTSSGYPDILFTTWEYFPDPWCFANWYLSPIGIGSINVGGYNNTVVNSLLAKADATINETSRGQTYQQIAQIVYNDYAYMSVAQRKAYGLGVIIISTSVAGYNINYGMWGSDYSTLYLTS